MTTQAAARVPRRPQKLNTVEIHNQQATITESLMKRKFFKISAILFIAYLAAAMVTFDFSQNAYPLDEEYYPNGRIRVLGPKPRSPLCRAALADIHYHGSEWPFLVSTPSAKFGGLKSGIWHLETVPHAEAFECRRERIAAALACTARKVRVEYPGAIYHVMNRGDRRGIFTAKIAEISEGVSSGTNPFLLQVSS